SPIHKEKEKQNKKEINYHIQDATIQDNNNNTCEATNTTIEEPNSRSGLISEISERYEIRKSHTQIEPNREQIIYNMGTKHEQATITKKENESIIKSASFEQTVNMKIEKTQVNNVNIQGSEQKIQTRSYIVDTRTTDLENIEINRLEVLDMLEKMQKILDKIETNCDKIQLLIMEQED
ncbi:7013_t:CDS:2, partial [Gigaspora margarita]